MITLLIFALPFLAALLMVLLGARADMRRIAMGTLLLQLSASGWLVYRLAGDSLIWMGSAPTLLPLEKYLVHPEAGSSFLAFIGIDAVSFPFLLLALCGFAIVLWEKIPVARAPGVLYPLLMVLNGCLVGAITAVNIVLLALFVLSVVCLMLLIARLWGDAGAHRAGRRFLPPAFAGALLMGAVLLGYATTPLRDLAPHVEGGQRFELPELADQEFRFRNESLRMEELSTNITGNFVLVATLILPVLFLMLFPFHSVFGSVLDAAPRNLVPLFMISGPALGFPLLIRSSLWVFPEFWSDGWEAYLMPVLGFLTVFYGGLVALGEFNRTRIRRFLLMGWCGLGIVLLSVQREAWIIAGLVSVFMATLVIALDSRRDSLKEGEKEQVIGSLLARLATGFLPFVPVLLCVLLLLDLILADSGYRDNATSLAWYVVGIIVAGGILSAASLRHRRLSDRSGIQSAVIAKGSVLSDYTRKDWSLGLVLVGFAVAGVWLLISLAGPVVKQVFERESHGDEVIGFVTSRQEPKHG